MYAVKPVASTRNRIGIAILGLLASSFMVSGLFIPGSFLLTFAFNYAIQEISIPVRLVATLWAIASVIQWCLMPLFGFLGDKFGRIRFIIIGIFLSCISVGVMGLASSPVLWGLCVFGQKIGAAMVIPCLMAYTLEAVTSRWFLAYAAAGYLVGSFSAEGYGITFAGQLIMDLGWSRSFAIVAGMGAFCLLVGALFMWIAGALKNRYHWQEQWLESARDQRWRTRLVLLLVMTFVIAIPVVIVFNHYFNNLYTLHIIPNASLIKLMVSFLIAYVSGISLGGILSDLLDGVLFKPRNRLFGRPGVLVLGAFIACVGMVVLMLAGVRMYESSLYFLPGAILSGAGLGMVSAPMLALLAGQVSHRRWGLLMAAYTVITGVAGYLASLVSQGMLSASGFVSGMDNQPSSVVSAVKIGTPAFTLVTAFITFVIGVVILALVSKSTPQLETPSS